MTWATAAGRRAEGRRCVADGAPVEDLAGQSAVGPYPWRVSLHLYDTASRSIRPFVPLRDGHASVYLCGATVQAPPHIGHLRSGLAFDLLRRWLEHSGLRVTFIRNVTDIDDKILRNAETEDVPFWEIAARNERAFTWGYDVLGCLPPSYEPRATGHVPEMVSLIQRLVHAGHAYAADGDVYFDVRSWPAYGELSRQRIDEMQPAADSSASGKRDPRDFALWKGAKPGEPSWQTPWGPGRPGWHLECSAMAARYLGPTFDVHGGGLDLVFPHHENELAQSRAVGDGFASFWMHNGWVTTSGEKMSKSLGNSLLASQVAQRVRPVELRYYLGSAHYRSHIEYSEPALEDAALAFRRVEGFLDRSAEYLSELGAPQAPAPVPDAFAAAMDDDLGVPQALAVVHDTVRAGNTALAEDRRHDVLSARLAVSAMTGVLGLDPDREPWRSAAAGAGPGLRPVVDALVEVALQQRREARERKDFAAADQVRDALKTAGIQLEDTPGGTRWVIEGRSES